jgi:hypothetical protein
VDVRRCHNLNTGWYNCYMFCSLLRWKCQTPHDQRAKTRNCIETIVELCPETLNGTINRDWDVIITTESRFSFRDLWNKGQESKTSIKMACDK